MNVTLLKALVRVGANVHVFWCSRLVLQRKDCVLFLLQCVPTISSAIRGASTTNRNVSRRNNHRRSAYLRSLRNTHTPWQGRINPGRLNARSLRPRIRTGKPGRLLATHHPAEFSKNSTNDNYNNRTASMDLHCRATSNKSGQNRIRCITHGT